MSLVAVTRIREKTLRVVGLLGAFKALLRGMYLIQVYSQICILIYHFLIEHKSISIISLHHPSTSFSR